MLIYLFFVALCTKGDGKTHNKQGGKKLKKDLEHITCLKHLQDVPIASIKSIKHDGKETLNSHKIED